LFSELEVKKKDERGGGEGGQKGCYRERDVNRRNVNIN
jgi:hypothetical protein